MVAAAKARLDEAVADGRLEAADAATRLAEVTERITTFVDEGFPAGEDRRQERPRPVPAPDTTEAPTTTPPTTTD